MHEGAPGTATLRSDRSAGVSDVHERARLEVTTVTRDFLFVIDIWPVAHEPAAVYKIMKKIHRRLSSLANPVKIEHDAPEPRSNVLGVKTKFLGHLQHARVFGQDVAIDTSQAFLLGVIDDTLHQQPA